MELVACRLKEEQWIQQAQLATRQEPSQAVLAQAQPGAVAPAGPATAVGVPVAAPVLLGWGLEDLDLPAANASPPTLAPVGAGKLPAELASGMTQTHIFNHDPFLHPPPDHLCEAGC